MSQQNINYSNPDDGFGDKLRNAFIKVQNNFTELFTSKVDKITGKGLSENDFTDADKDKLDGIEAGAQVNVNADFGENDTDAPGYILNRPPSLYASVGYFDHNDLATQTTPINYINYTNAYLRNDALGSFTDLSQAPYNVANIWDTVNNQFDFNDLQIGDTLDLRVDLLISTTGTNKTGKVFLKLGIGTPSEYDVLVGSNEFKSAVTDEKIICETSFYIGSEDIRTAPAKLYAYVDTTGTIKVNGWYTRILRKNLNLVTIAPDNSKLDKVTTTDVEKVYIKKADGTQGMKPVSELLSEILITDATVTGTYNIDYSAGDVWDLTLTGNTTLTESNAPASGTTKTITLEVSGNYTLSYPSSWTSKITGAYSGTATLNTITIQYYGSGKYKVLIVQPS